MGDYNNDGLLDLYIARGNVGGQGDMEDALYRNAFLELESAIRS